MELLLSHAPIVGLLIFFIIFCSILVWMVRPGMKQKLQKLAYIPLEEDAHGKQ
jgi:cbb3-type cytochrome oxidase subunit 3